MKPRDRILCENVSFGTDLLHETVALKPVVEEKVVMRGVFEGHRFDYFAAQNAADDGTNGRELGKGEGRPRRLEPLCGNSQFGQVGRRQLFQRGNVDGALGRIGKCAVMRRPVLEKESEG